MSPCAGRKTVPGPLNRVAKLLNTVMSAKTFAERETAREVVRVKPA